jgi:hydroxyacylglutathione hydrolase
MKDNLKFTRLVVGGLSANCYIAGREADSSGFLIDPGGNAREICEAIDKSGYNIETIILTHGHSDHIAALYEVRQYTGAEVMIHRFDAEFLTGYGPVSSQFGISYTTPDPPDRLLDDGDAISVGSLSLAVIHTPGHTPGSICLMTGNYLFTGDTLLRRGIGTTLMPGSSRRQLVESIRTRLLCLPNETTVLPGHGQPTTIAEERVNNRYIN